VGTLNRSYRLSSDLRPVMRRSRRRPRHGQARGPARRSGP